ncbi:alpha/beta fold hydrolase [Marinobacter oulmenensis]|uniref:Pimeloyl-ACP methyl ester carboxylesterase n=1 Tax=Marinobacter oulmenensis TaxID=643747 RepID=A0A840UCA0_9GAMM|nr:alpha/beta hydrolase [Marinobacter oulmenensis]MBB5321823.1 pimeloyl-ACP methyl ester carboxylesterase [Marinobacter oulmenensis]
MTEVAIDDSRIRTSRGEVFARRWSPKSAAGAPIVLLHDSLGCVALWRDFPEALARSLGRGVIAYDRPGYGESTPHEGRQQPSFIDDEPGQAFAAVLDHFGIGDFVVLGHSVGGGMAAAVAAAFPERCLGLVTEAAQAYVEERTRQGIREAEQGFADPEQMARLARYHGEKADWVLRAWVDTWHSKAFDHWSLDDTLVRVSCPVLAMHGDQDEFGSAGQPERIASLSAGPAEIRILPACGHVPHREQPDVVLSEVARFLDRIGA